MATEFRLAQMIQVQNEGLELFKKRILIMVTHLLIMDL